MRLRTHIYFTLAAILQILLISEQTEGQTPQTFRIGGMTKPGKAGSLLSNAVTDFAMGNDGTLWIGTGRGLNSTSDEGLSFDEFPAAEFAIGMGGISALETNGSVVWVATAFDSEGVEESNGTGSGLAYSMDGGATWIHIAQPKDPEEDDLEVVFGDTINALPVVINIDNITFDIALAGDSTVYITSFAGGARKSTDFGRTWKRVVLPPDGEEQLNAESTYDFDLSPVDNSFYNVSGSLNHRPFTVIAWGDTVYMGTAGGINFSYDGGLSWTNRSAQNSNISGNWVVALHRHVWRGKETIFAGTRPATGAGEFHAVSMSTDSGDTWKAVLEGEKVWNFASRDSIVYAATDGGLFKSVDGGLNWASYHPPVDEIMDRHVLTSTVYSVYDAQSGKLWVGTGDGLAVTENDGSAWTMHRAFEPLSASSGIRTYSYPNPFSPSRYNVSGGDGHVRIHYKVDEPSVVSIGVYDFSMSLVADVLESKPRNAGEWDDIWNGRSGLDRVVANGTYFYKVSIRVNSGGERVHWGKIMVLD